MFFNSFKYKSISWKYAPGLNDFPKIYVPIDEAEIIFNTYASRYLGLGFVMSFIPGTNAYRARQNFSAQLASAVKKVNIALEDEPSSVYWLNVKTRLLGPVLYVLLLGPLWQSLINIVKYLDRKDREIRLNFVTVYRLFANLPLFFDIFSADIFTNLFHTILNPVRLISQSLNFAQMLIYGTLELILGIGDQHESNFLVRSLKSLVALPFALASLIVSPVEIVFDIPYQIINGIGSFFVGAITQAFNKNITSKNLEEILTKSEATLETNVVNVKAPIVSSASTHRRVLNDLGVNNIETQQELNNDSDAPETPNSDVSTQSDMDDDVDNDDITPALDINTRPSF